MEEFRQREALKLPLKMEVAKAKSVSDLLFKAFSTTGIHGNKEMPEDIVPKGAAKGSLDHLLFITLTVAIDYQRDADALWAVSRRSFEDLKTRYLYDPEALHKTPFKKIIEDIQKYGLSKKSKQDPTIWRTVGVTFYKKWGGSPLNFLEDCEWDALTILKRLKGDAHLYNGREVPDFPFLRGNKIGPLWLRMLRDNVGISKLENLRKVPIPVDIHIARATLATGIVHGAYRGKLDDLFEYIRSAWFRGVEGLKVANRPMIALDVDEPLWHLSKYGCANRDKSSGYCPVVEKCEARSFCIKGQIKLEKGWVELDT